jgi:tripartite motif-containing protein 71
VYGVMAGPVTFTVTAPPPVTMPSYTGQLNGGSADALSGPYGVALDASGDVWVADTYNNRVVELSPSDTVLQSFGTEGSGPGQLNNPDAIAVDGSGHVFVADTGNNRVEEYDTNGTFVATIGSAGTGNGQFDDPEGVAVDGNGDLYVADTDNNRVEEFSVATGSFTKAITTGMADPQGLAADSSGDLWVADNGITDNANDSVAEYSPSGSELTSFGSSTSQFGGMSNPAAVAVSGGNVYVSEPDYEFVQEFTTTGVYEGEFGTPADGAGTLNLPQAVAVNAAGSVFVADSGNNRIAEFSLVAPPASTPEAPLAIYLPIGALGIGAAAWRVAGRRPRRRAASGS